MMDRGAPPRSAAQIIARYEAVKDEDWLGFRAEVLLNRLTFEEAAPYLASDATAEGWGAVEPSDPFHVGKEAREYMEFAWGKVQDHRGISANRSVDKMTEYVWLLGREDLAEGVKAVPYEQYGAPKLAYFCKAMGWPIPDDQSTQRMIAGEPCYPDCEEGCGRGFE